MINGNVDIFMISGTKLDVDIFMISETKLDETLLAAQFSSCRVSIFFIVNFK